MKDDPYRSGVPLMIPQPVNEPRRLPWSPASLRAALPDYLARRLGLPPSANDHPLTDELVDRDLPTRDVVLNADAGVNALLALTGERRAEYEAQIRARVVGFYTSSDFQAALGNVLQKLVIHRYVASAGHLRLISEVQAQNYKPIEFPVSDLRIDESDDTPTVEHGEARADLQVSAAGGLTGRVDSWSRTIGFSRRLFLADQLGVIASAVGQLGPYAARREARSVFGVLTSNPVLTDTRALFNATDGNLLTGAALTLANLGTAFALLRRQRTLSGNESGAAPRFLVVSPEKEISALDLVRQLSASQHPAPLEVIADAALPAAQWYLLADPAAAPVIGFLKLGRNTMSVDRAPTPFRYDGIGYRFRHDYGVVALGRVGAVRAES